VEPAEVVALAASILALVGIPVGILWKAVEKGYERELHDKDRQIEDWRRIALKEEEQTERYRRLPPVGGR
jgi:hypothetical protein